MKRRRKTKQTEPDNAEFVHYLRAQAHLDSRAQRGDGPQRPGKPCRANATGADPCPCETLSRPAVAEAVADPALNRRTWRALCLAHLAKLIEHDGWTLRQADPTEIELGLFGLPVPSAPDTRTHHGAVAVFVSSDGKRAWHIFFDDQAPTRLRRAATHIARSDQNRFRTLAVLVFPNRRALEPWREIGRAKQWPRGLLLAFDEIRDACADDARTRIPLPCPALTRSTAPDRHARAIVQIQATVKENLRIGGTDSPYAKLRIEAPELTDIAPGQFVMLDTAPRRRAARPLATSWPAFKVAFERMPNTYLKRPFGIHRAFYPGFDPAVYLRRLNLPSSVAMLAHTVRPHAFDIFYKVPPRGKGTREMRRLTPGQRVRMIGPLGRPFDLDALLARGVDEVHAIGGGVGMAPLIFLIQALRFRGIPVKAFIGIESLDRLHYRAGRRRRRAAGFERDADFTAESGDACVYIDDLKQVGIEPESLFLSSDQEAAANPPVPAAQYRTGLVSALYADALRRLPKGKRIEAFACGPTPMMKAIYDLTRPRDVRLHVLMEKRMACGIGVCLSCVCKTNQGYARVCRDGPVFEASEIVWT